MTTVAYRHGRPRPQWRTILAEARYVRAVLLPDSRFALQGVRAVCAALRDEPDGEIHDASLTSRERHTARELTSRLSYWIRVTASCGCLGQWEECPIAPCGEHTCAHDCGWCHDGDHARCDPDHSPCDDCDTCGCDGSCGSRDPGWPWCERSWSWRDVLAPAGTPAHPRAAGIEIEIAGAGEWTAELNVIVQRWRITVKEDGSVVGGAELATRPARGDETPAMIRDLCGALRRARATVDTRCGLHVHVAARALCGDEHEPTLRRRALLCAWWAVADDVYDTLAGRNPGRFCREIGKPWELALWDSESPEYRYSGISRRSEAWLTPDRYVAVNLHALYEHRTVEWRLFAAHIDPERMIAQVSLVQRLTHWAATAPLTAIHAAITAGPLADRGLAGAALPARAPALLDWCAVHVGAPDTAAYESEAA